MHGETTVMEFAPDSKKTQKGKYRTVDRETVWRLATIQCSYAEMAQVTGLSEKGLKKKLLKSSVRNMEYSSTPVPLHACSLLLA